ncbi:MAG: sulfatase-like hydrolase/transferase [Steroidobacteraceae bacterium]
MQDRKLKPWAEVALSQLLALTFMAACLWWVQRQLELVLPNNRITAALSIENAIGTTLGLQLTGFGGALLLCHVLLGLAAYSLARLTQAAFPGNAQARPAWLIAGWFALLAGMTLAANTTWHPASIFSAEESWWRRELLGVQPVRLLAGGVAISILLLVLPILRRPYRPGRRLVIASLSGAVLAAAFALPKAMFAASANAGAVTAPHVVIIGIDSLRNDLTVPRRGNATTPHIDDFLTEATRFSDATSPLARTYPSWMAILTGRHPVTTNARYNLMPRADVREGETLADALRARGYRAVYATDKVRFANFDESFGFDELITPTVGAVDFLLGYAGDNPLVNLVASTRAGGWLFPSNYANRGAYVTYRPRQFVERLENELRINGPSFLAIHLTLAHWPYVWAGMKIPGAPPDYRIAYGVAVNEVDRQFHAVMQLLEERGVLDNAIVVLLSDHGEALGADTDSMLRNTGNSREIWDSLWGHGTSVLSLHQYGVMLAIRAYGRAAIPGKPGSYEWPVTLEDVRPTLEQYVTGKMPAAVDGISLLPLLANPGDAKSLATRVRFTETDFNTPSTLAGRYEASGLIDEAAVYYELEPKSGWVQIRSNRLPELIARKQRAALSSQSLLAAIPDPAGGPPKYLYTARHNPLPRTLDGPPDATRDPEARRLWDALHARFPGELPAGSDLPRM